MLDIKKKYDNVSDAHNFGPFLWAEIKKCGLQLVSHNSLHHYYEFLSVSFPWKKNFFKKICKKGGFGIIQGYNL